MAEEAAQAVQKGQPMTAEDRAALRCMDCSAIYADFPLDTTLPDEQWRMIHDSDGGILCASCIVKRASRLPKVIAVRATIEFECLHLVTRHNWCVNCGERVADV